MSRESDIISTILTDLGWDENLAVPIANEENQKLLHLIDLKQKQTSTNKTDLERINSKLSNMTNHLRNCRQELSHSLNLKRAKASENESESHLDKVESREIGRLNQELHQLQVKIEEIQVNKNIYENTLFKKTTELEELKQQMKWDQQALEAWLEESEKKGEDILSIQKYQRQDESKIQELSLKLEQHTAIINERRNQLEKQVIETKTTHVQLEKTTDEFSKAHEERQKILIQWEATIDQLKRRDQEIDSLSAKLSLLRSEVAKLQDQMKSKQEFFDNLVNNNAEIENTIQMTERQAGRLRVEHRDTDMERASFKSELDALRRTCDRTASDLEQARVTISLLKKEKLDKDVKLERGIMLRMELEAKLKKVCDDKTSAEEKANLADKMLEDEENSHLKFEQILKQKRDAQFKSAQELFDAETDQKTTIAEINGSRSALKNLNTKILRLDHDLLKQQEILYIQEFAIQALERRNNKMMGDDHSSEEKDRLEAVIGQLTANLDEVRHTCSILIGQTKRLSDELRRAKSDSDKVELEYSMASTKLDQVNLENERSQQELGRCRTEKERSMVEANIMKLEVKRLRDRLYSKAEQVYTLDMRKQQLEQAVKERFREIQIHKDMLQSQIRSAEEEKSKLNGDWKARLSKIDKLEKRYEIITVTMGRSEEETDKDQQSQAYYVIKAAQDKEALQRQGDELDAKIRKTEKEIRALENTLLLMNTCNHNYRKSLTRVTDVSAEVQTKSDVEVQLRTVMDKYNFRKRQLIQSQEDFQVLKETYDNLLKDEGIYREQVDSLLDQLKAKEKEQIKYHAKLDRAENQIIKLHSEISDMSPEIVEEFQFVVSDIKLRERKEFNRIAVNELNRHIQSSYAGLVDISRQYLEGSQLLDISPAMSSIASSSRSSTIVASPGSSVASSAKRSVVNVTEITPSFQEPPHGSRGSVASSKNIPRAGSIGSIASSKKASRSGSNASSNASSINVPRPGSNASSINVPRPGSNSSETSLKSTAREGSKTPKSSVRSLHSSGSKISRRS